jgi:DNA polymerase-3 subunit delta'
MHRQGESIHMPFSEIIGHERPLYILRRALDSGRLAHAYLFVGSDGVGKATTARSFVKALQCRSTEGGVCDGCEACLKVDHGNHPDVFAVEPQSTQIRIDQIRAVQRQLIHRPLEGRWRTIVIDDAHNLTLQAANALLKTLEEPPADNILILIARATAALLPTVVSRCQVLYFSPLSVQEISRFLQQKRGMSEQEADRIAVRAQGSIRSALAMEKPDLSQDSEILEFFETLPEMNGGDILARVAAWTTGRSEVQKWLITAQSLFRDLVALQLGGTVERRELLEAFRSTARHWRLDDLLLGWESTMEALRGLERNWNPQMLLEHLLLDLHAETRKTSDRSGRYHGPFDRGEYVGSHSR